MMNRFRALKWMIGIIEAVLVMTASVPAFAQGCAMCYNNAAAAKASAIQALRSGVLILLFPVLILFIGILVAAFRSRNRFNQAEAATCPPVSGDAGEWANLLTAREIEPLRAASDAQSVLPAEFPR
jgi:cbb3-type cytochrome oxidase subunit 3